ncbi:YheC/YheD family protein [Aneurinibacillus sp. Ricciae_BoGa-3]|uniref:YheC/YheD family endospore coat-associated protein n=1 Tax=Aneurinibacillus sp. Ricciae_BoGa-3 TaxID=3022697 RepID=UPI0023425D45|nr:YheC/YheD family protein [Aneurinibacillus sp. Ricciae_BoGa-3]WCK55498.1 YheC/YheD family protein [Aneurinibacillus sp. Ricciae_BoGa-3]
MNKLQGYLGILATPIKTSPPFPEKAFYAYLSAAGKNLGIPVYVFLPNQVDYTTKTVIGYLYRNKTWVKKKLPFPTLVYDRCSNRKVYGKYIRKIKTIPSITFLAHVLPGKWQNHQNLIQHPGLIPYLPATEVIQSMETVKRWLDDYGSVVIKPVQNSLGVGVIKVTSLVSHTVEGRDMKNKIFHKNFSSRTALIKWLKEAISGNNLIQPYLDLSTPEGDPFDLRVLVQKNETGRWQETARAIRAGVCGGLTSNLCGGGKAYSADAFLQKYFPEEQLVTIHQNIDYLVQEIPPFIESKHGRLAELGIDIGIDKKGNVWLIEINSKPGRASFRKVDGGAFYNKARLNPLKYASYLARRRAAERS